MNLMLRKALHLQEEELDSQNQHHHNPAILVAAMDKAQDMDVTVPNLMEELLHLTKLLTIELQDDLYQPAVSLPSLTMNPNVSLSHGTFQMKEMKIFALQARLTQSLITEMS